MDQMIYAVGAAHLVVYSVVGGTLILVYAGSQAIEWALPRLRLKREFLAFAVHRYKKRRAEGRMW